MLTELESSFVEHSAHVPLGKVPISCDSLHFEQMSSQSRLSTLRGKVKSAQRIRAVHAEGQPSEINIVDI